MPETVLIVEGHGDVDAFPVLVGKVGGWLGLPLHVTRPIRCGGWGSIRKAGGLEKWIALARSRPNCTRVVIVVDLDDGCPVETRAEIHDRAANLAAAYGIEIEICFCLREFEAWLLSSLDIIAAARPELNVKNPEIANQDNSTIRDAKGLLRSQLIDGYSESADQPKLTRALRPPILYLRDRSFRRFAKALSGQTYEALLAACVE